MLAPLPQMAWGSDASTTKSPSWLTLKLKLGACGSARGFARNGLRAFVRLISTLSWGICITLAHAWRCSSRLTNARFLSGMCTILRQSARSCGGMRVSRNWNSAPRWSPSGAQRAVLTAQRRRAGLAPRPHPSSSPSMMASTARATGGAGGRRARRLRARTGKGGAGRLGVSGAPRGVGRRGSDRSAPPGA